MVFPIPHRANPGKKAFSSAPTCVVTYDEVATEMDITGSGKKTFSVTNNSSTGTDGAREGPDRDFWASGIRWIEASNASRSNASSIGIRVSFSSQSGLHRFFAYAAAGSSVWVVEVQESLSTVASFTTSVPVTSPIAIGMDGSNGNCMAWGPSGQISLPAGFDGFWQGDTEYDSLALNHQLIFSATGLSASIDVATDRESFVNGQTGQDYCGTTIK